MALTITEGEFKGKPILTIRNDKRILFSAGLNKLKVVLGNIEAIKEFVAKHIDKANNNNIVS